MNTLKLIIEANYEKHLLQEVITKEYNNTILDEQSLMDSISKIVQTISDLVKKEPIKQVSFSVNIINSSGELVKKYDEKLLFSEAVAFDSLTESIFAYIEVTSKGEYDARMWFDEENPCGNYAIFPLIMKDKKWMPQYIDFLRTSDLDHEVYQAEDIEKVILKYGWCKETCALVIARLFSCCGQFGYEQFVKFFEEGLAKYITQADQRQIFFDELINEFKYTEYFDIDLEEAKDDYIEGIIQDLEEIEDFLTEDELDELAEELGEIWEEYNS